MSDLVKANNFLKEMKGGGYCETSDAVEVITALLGQIEASEREAESLAVSLHKRHYGDVTQWELCDSTAGVILQINNMVAGLNEQIEAKDEALFQMEKGKHGRDYYVNKKEILQIKNDELRKEIKLTADVVEAAKSIDDYTNGGLGDRFTFYYLGRLAELNEALEALNKGKK